MFGFSKLARLLNVAGCFSKPVADAYFQDHQHHLLNLLDTPDAVDPGNLKSGQCGQFVLFPASIFWHLLACLIAKRHRDKSTNPL